ncbi:hypothetical protein [Pseudomonas sp. C11]|uniref:hypothetical protein n=1 Tax=Pseudomonas sp. C11 TaxID=3075550 RepID=UPI002AFFA616|nr:hypothetical protein [Pseudomonas sp. C11]
MTDQVECNCAWNPDSHAETCPVYMQQQIKALRQHKTDYMESAEATRKALEADIARLKGMLEAAQDHAVVAQLHALEMGQRALRAALHSCAKASSAAEVGLIVDGAIAASQAQQALAPENQRVVPADPLLAKPHPFEAMRKRFSDIEDEVARGKHSAMSCFTAMRTAALYTDPQPAQVNRIPAGLYAELEALRTLRDAADVYLQGYMRDEIEDEDNCVSVDQHDAACSVKSALDNARALEWKGGGDA